MNNVYLFVFLPTSNEISRLTLSPLGTSTCDRSHIVHCCCALLIVFKGKKTLKTRNFTTVWAAERENDKDCLLAAFDLLSWETFLRGWHRCFLETRERETCGEVRPSLRTLPSLVHMRSVGCLFAVSAAHLAGLWGKVPILSLCPEATCGSVGCRTVKLQRRGTWISQRHFLSMSCCLETNGERPHRASPSTNKHSLNVGDVLLKS